MMPEIPEEPIDLDRALESAVSLESARLTLRWALQRVSRLEAAHAEMSELLKQGQEARERALRDSEAARQSLIERSDSLRQKERFVTDLEGMLKSVFNGQISPQELIAQKQETERLKLDLEAKLLRLSEEAQERRRLEIEEQTRRLAEIEKAHAQALAEVQENHRKELAAIERQRQEEALNQSAKESRFREDLAEQLQKQADQYHQKMTLLQIEYAARREDLQREFDGLKDKLFHETRQIEGRQSFAVRVAEARWLKEREELEQQLKQLEKRNQELIQKEAGRAQEMEAVFHQQLKTQLERWQAHVADLQAMHRIELENVREALRRVTADHEARLSAEAQERLKLSEQLIRQNQEALRAMETAHAKERSDLHAATARQQECQAHEFQERLAALEEARGAEAAAVEEKRQRETTALREEMRRAAAEHEEQKKAEAHEWSRLLEELRGRHRIELQNLETRRAKEREELQASSVREQERQTREFERQLAALQQRHQVEIADLQARQQKEFDSMREAARRDAATFQETLARIAHEHESRLAAESAERRKLHQDLTAQYQKALEALQASRGSEETFARVRDLEARLAQSEESRRAEAAESTKKHQAELAALREKSQKDLGDTLQRTMVAEAPEKSKTLELEKQLVQSQERQRAEIAELKRKHQEEIVAIQDSLSKDAVTQESWKHFVQGWALVAAEAAVIALLAVLAALWARKHF